VERLDDCSKMIYSIGPWKGFGIPSLGFSQFGCSHCVEQPYKQELVDEE
jgi:hypothetical protein